jgi:hypothetical protein
MAAPGAGVSGDTALVASVMGQRFRNEQASAKVGAMHGERISRETADAYARVAAVLAVIQAAVFAIVYFWVR